MEDIEAHELPCLEAEREPDRLFKVGVLLINQQLSLADRGEGTILTVFEGHLDDRVDLFNEVKLQVPA